MSFSNAVRLLLVVALLGGVLFAGRFVERVPETVERRDTFDAPVDPGPSTAVTEVGHGAFVFDADSIEVTIDGRRERVRLIGVDAPEPRAGPSRRKDPSRFPEPFANEATAFTRRLTAGVELTLVPDPAEGEGPQRRDRYGRLLRYVLLPDGTMLDELLVRNGLAFVYAPGNGVHRERFVEAERNARLARRGVWSEDVVSTVAWDEAPDHVGRVVELEGFVLKSATADSADGAMTFLNFGPDVRRHVSVVIFPEDRARFPEDLEAAYVGHEVRVLGRVDEYRPRDGAPRPQVIVTSPDQIERVGGL